MKKIYLFLVICLLFGFAFARTVSAISFFDMLKEFFTSSNKSEKRVCIEVITPAKNLVTGECKEFPTPCDVPAGWEKVDKCDRKIEVIPPPPPPSDESKVDELIERQRIEKIEKWKKEEESRFREVVGYLRHTKGSVYSSHFEISLLGSDGIFYEVIPVDKELKSILEKYLGQRVKIYGKVYPPSQDSKEECAVEPCITPQVARPQVVRDWWWKIYVKQVEKLPPLEVDFWGRLLRDGNYYKMEKPYFECKDKLLLVPANEKIRALLDRYSSANSSLDEVIKVYGKLMMDTKKDYLFYLLVEKVEAKYLNQ